MQLRNLLFAGVLTAAGTLHAATSTVTTTADSSRPRWWFIPPAIVSIAPATGPTAGGTVVTISGSGFVVGSTVTFGGRPAVWVGFADWTTLSAVTPEHGAGAVDVTVTRPGNQSGTAHDAFTYVCVKPVITDQPDDTVIRGGTKAVLSVAATGMEPLAYQWFVGPAGDTSSPVPGGTLATLEVSPATDTAYWVRVTDLCGSTESEMARVRVVPPRRRAVRR